MNITAKTVLAIYVGMFVMTAGLTTSVHFYMASQIGSEVIANREAETALIEFSQATVDMMVLCFGAILGSLSMCMAYLSGEKKHEVAQEPDQKTPV